MIGIILPLYNIILAYMPYLWYEVPPYNQDHLWCLKVYIAVFRYSSKQPFCITCVIILMSINVCHAHSWQSFLTIAVNSVSFCLSMQDIKYPNLMWSTFLANYLIWRLSILIKLYFLTMRRKWASTIYRYSAFMCVQWHSQHVWVYII